jgi:hypothetical protein
MHAYNFISIICIQLTSYISFFMVMICRKVWVHSSKPYPISLTLKTLQQMLNNELPMDRDCFNLVVRKIMFDNIQTIKKRRGFILKHYLDIKFWVFSYIHYIFVSTYILFIFITFLNTYYIYFIIS